MWLFKQTSPAARVSLTYITAGALTIVWSVIWFSYLANHLPETSGPYYWASGSLASGITLLVIGLSLGWIGHSSRPAEAPAATATVVESAVANGAVPVAGLSAPAPTVAPPVQAPMAVPGHAGTLREQTPAQVAHANGR